MRSAIRNCADSEGRFMNPYSIGAENYDGQVKSPCDLWPVSAQGTGEGELGLNLLFEFIRKE